jgi:hypothetical protein
MWNRTLTLVRVAGTLLVSGCADNPLIVTDENALAAAISRANAAPDRVDDVGIGVIGRRPLLMADSTLFAIGAEVDSVFILGLKHPGSKRGNWHGEVFVNSDARSQFAAIVSGSDRGISLVGRDSILPVLYLRISSKDALTWLRRQPFVDYLEPNALPRGDRALLSSDGCDAPLVTDPVTYDSNGEIINPPFVTENLYKAWIVSQGGGVTLGLADTRIPSNQTEFYPTASRPDLGFATGLSGGRLFEQQDGGGADFSHAVRMGIIMAAPRNGIGTNGVAWRANLRSGAALSGINIQWGPSMTQIMLGVRYAANEENGNVKHVVAMAFGQITGSDLLADEIRRLYYQRDVVFIGAAGTGVPNWPGGGSDVVIFPASMPEVLAVSGTTMSGGKDPESSGNAKVELTAIVPNLVGNYNLFTTGPSSATTTQMSHSSSATAVISGVAALVRSRFPQLNNEGVRFQLTRRFLGGCGTGRNDWKPVVDALAAVGSFCGNRLIADIAPVEFNCLYSPAQTITVYTSPVIGQNPFTFLWGNGSTQASTAYTVSPPQGTTKLWYNTTSVSLTATDPLLEESRSESVFILARVRDLTTCRR